jgi:hypothetical protein
MTRCITWRCRTLDRFCVREPREILATCDAWPTLVAELADDGPEVTVVVRCGPVVRGPDVARCGPSSHELGRHVRAVCSAEILRRWRSSRSLLIDRCCPWLTVSDRCYGHAEGHGSARTNPALRGSDGRELNRRVRRPNHDDHLPRWQEPQARGSYWGEGLEPAVGLLQRRRLAPQRGLRWRFSMPVVTGRDRSQPFS